MKAATKVGDEYAAKALNLPETVDKDLLLHKLREVQFSRNNLQSKQLDLVMKEATDKFNNSINTFVEYPQAFYLSSNQRQQIDVFPSRACLPKGLLKKFPHNNLQLMVQSGAKGSIVSRPRLFTSVTNVTVENNMQVLRLFR